MTVPRGGICIGLMSGTSLDAIDAAACEFDHAGQLRQLISTATRPYPPALRQALLDLQRNPRQPLAAHDWVALDQQVGAAFAAAAQQLLEQLALTPAQVLVIGSHGQTVFHEPLVLRSSIQLGNPNLIAQGCGITTAADFRRADLALGGQGAPLVPAFHHALFAGDTPRVIVNIGGIANITVLPGRDPAQVFGFDTGPGNALMDDWTQRHRQQPYDRDGVWAAQGSVDHALLARCLSEPYFGLPPPKSTGRDLFGLAWLQRHTETAALAPVDVQRTLLELTVESIMRAIERYAPATASIHVCGGGAGNRQLMLRLAERAGAARAVASTAGLGLDPGWVEACAFAWLGWRRLHGLPGNLPAVTGAQRAAVLGGLYAP